jgi:hypothetical protein
MMRDRNTHLSDENLVRFADGETSTREDTDIRNHLAACWSCRLRMRKLEGAIVEVARMHRRTAPLPASEGPRALLKLRLRALAAGPDSATRWSVNRLIGAVSSFAAIGCLLAVIWLAANSDERNSIPRSDLTPGVVRSLAASDVCRAPLTGNAAVLPAVQRQVFAEYGMPDARIRSYEVDYLITPALGGSDDIRNLWPQPYAGSPWNAYVKDALEEHLRGMVCDGQLDLATAQHEIAVNWIAAYRKHFHTRQPLPQHQRLLHKDP